MLLSRTNFHNMHFLFHIMKYNCLAKVRYVRKELVGRSSKCFPICGGRNILMGQKGRHYPLDVRDHPQNLVKKLENELDFPPPYQGCRGKRRCRPDKRGS